jgi:hypothetical protein
VNINSYIKDGLNHLNTKKNKAKKCPICGKLNFNLDLILDEWFSQPRRYYDLSDIDKRILRNELIRRFVIPENICNLEIHHISYKMEITMPLCIECHKKVHNIDDEPWCKYKPIDKKPCS